MNKKVKEALEQIEILDKENKKVSDTPMPDISNYYLQEEDNSNLVGAYMMLGGIVVVIIMLIVAIINWEVR